MNNQELALIEDGENVVAQLGISRPPEVVLAEAQRAAEALQQVINSKAKPVKFNGEVYLQFEDWITVARFYGLTARTRSTSYVEYGNSRGWEATADVVSVATEQVVSTAQAMCLNDEPTWSRKPMFQLRSMAQTRACSKALRNVLSWVVVLAGYRGTPAEEMSDVHASAAKTQPRKPQTELQQLQATMVDRDSVGRALQGLLNQLSARDGEEQAFIQFARILEGYGVTEWQALGGTSKAKAVARELYDLLHQETLFVEEPESVPF